MNLWQITVVALVIEPTLAESKVGGCINTVPLESNVPDNPYAVSEITPGESCNPFSKIVQAYGLLFTAGTQGQVVPDNALKWLAKATTELFPSTASDQATQKLVLQNMYRYRAANPVFVGKFVDAMAPAKDVLSMCDTITIGQLEGPDGSEGKKAQILEVYEHLLHIITDVGFSKTWPSQWGVTASSDLHAAMMEAVDKKIYSISSYAHMDEEGRTRVQLQEFAYWAISTIQGVHSTYFHGAPTSTDGEWTLMSAAEVQSQLPLFWALHTATSATVLGEISASTMTQLGELYKAGSPQTATWPIVDAGRGTLPTGAALVDPCGGSASGGGGGQTLTMIIVGAVVGIAALVGLGLFYWRWYSRRGGAGAGGATAKDGVVTATPTPQA